MNLLNNIVFTHYLEIELVQRTSTCSGEKIDVGDKKELKDCVKACRSVSSMFIFAKKKADGWNSCYPLCNCKCESEAGKDGKCDTVNSNAYSYALFRYTGNVFIKQYHSSTTLQMQRQHTQSSTGNKKNFGSKLATVIVTWMISWINKHTSLAEQRETERL